MRRAPVCRQGLKHWSKVGGSESGEARIEGTKSPRFESLNLGQSQRKSGGGVWGEGSVSPSPENFWNFGLQIVQSGV